MGILLLCHLLAIVVWIGFVAWNAHRDAAAIAADGAANSLHEKFHRQRLTMRVGAAVGLAVAANVAAWPSLLPAAGLLCFLTGWFAWRFNTMVSLLRGLDPFYVSKDPDAALFPDRLMTRWQVSLRPVLLAAVWAGALAEVTGLVWYYYG